MNASIIQPDPNIEKTMKKATILALALIMPVVAALASPVDKEAAKATATAFLQQKVASASGRHNAPRQLNLVSAQEENAPYYVFNNQNGQGFAIVSGEDTVEDPILGYSTEGNLSEENMPDALRLCLEDYAKVVKYAQTNGLSMKRAPRKAHADTYIPPFVSFRWAQSAPYSNNCPEYTVYDEDGNPTGTKHMSTGCMAVTTAMICAYYKYPETVPSAWNTSEGVGNEEWTYNYEAFQNSYSTSASQETLGEMPMFMFHIANHLNTDYSSSGSGATQSNLLPALRRLGFNQNIRDLDRSGFSSDDFEDIIYAELQAKRPVNFIGEHDYMGGHSFLCDGYQNGKYHILWGWGNTCVGYFDLNILDPFPEQYSGWGYSFPPGSFTNGLKAVVGIQPETIEEDPATLVLTADNVTGNSSNVQGMFYNYNASNFAGQLSWATLNSDGTFDVLNITTVNVNNLSSKAYLQASFSPASLGLADGIYKVVPVCKTNTATDWLLCQGYQKAYAEVIIANGEITVVAHPVKKLSVESVVFAGVVNNGFNEYIVSIKNEGDDLYGSLAISGMRSDNVSLSGSAMNIGLPGGKTETFSVSLEKGDGSAIGKTYEMTINFAGENIWTGSVATNNSLLDKSNVAYDSYEFDNFEAITTFSNKLYSTTLNGVVRVKAKDTHCIPIRFKIIDTNSKVVFTKTQQVYVTMGTVQDYPIVCEGLESGKTYYFSIDAVKTTRTTSGGTTTYKETVLKELNTNVQFTVEAAIPYVDGNGVEQRYNGGGVATLPANTTVVDLTMANVSQVNVNAITNPNCIYLLAANTTIPSALEGKNVVVGTHATKINFTDEYPAYIPITFNADEATYTRTFTKGNNGDDQGWETIVLPFRAKATVDGNDQPWFHSASESGLKFWLYKFNGSYDGTVNFGFETNDYMTANEPYLIAVPGDAWGPKYDLRNKEFTFHGENVSFTGNAKPEKKAGTGYIFKGGYANMSFNNGYKLNATGDFFELTAEGTENPFRAYFVGANSSTTGKTNLVVDFGEIPTAIGEVMIDSNDSKQAIFDLQGRRVQNAQKGIYIQNGKKVVIK